MSEATDSLALTREHFKVARHRVRLAAREIERFSPSTHKMCMALMEGIDDAEDALNETGTFYSLVDDIRLEESW